MLRLPECGVCSGRSEEELGWEKSCQRDRKDGRGRRDRKGRKGGRKGRNERDGEDRATFPCDQYADLLLKVLDGEMDKDAVMEAMGM